MMAKELYLKLTLEWLRGEKLSLRLMRNYEKGVRSSNLCQSLTFLYESCFPNTVRGVHV